MREPAPSRPELARDLTVSHATAIVIGTVIGSGIFLVPAEMMQAVGSSGLVYLAWIVGGVRPPATALHPQCTPGSPALTNPPPASSRPETKKFRCHLLC